ncbi:MAG: hypothetical protein R3F18_09510 [Lysobacterales bacterium]
MKFLPGKKFRIPRRFRLAKGYPLESMQIWKEVVDIVSPFTQQLLDALNDGLKNAEKAQKAIGVFRSLVQATAGQMQTPTRDSQAIGNCEVASNLREIGHTIRAGRKVGLNPQDVF